MEETKLDEMLRVKFRTLDLKHKNLIQPPIRQGYEQCSFAAVSMQLDYQLRHLYSKSWVRIEFPIPENGCLFDHIKWQADLNAKFPNKSRWIPQHLLAQAKSVGAPLWNGAYHIIQEDLCFYLRCEKIFRNPDDVLKMLIDFCPCVGVFEVRGDYRPDGDSVYHGSMPQLNDVTLDDVGKDTKPVAYHAVVLLDYLVVNDIMYVIYQSFDGDSHRSLLKRGISVVESRLIVEAFYGGSIPPVHPSAVFLNRYQLDSTQKDIDGVTKLSKMTDEWMDECRRLCETTETHLTKCEWNDVNTSLKNIENVMEKLRHPHHCMSEFIRRFGDVERAAVESSLGVGRIVKYSNNFLSFHKEMIEFQSKIGGKLKSRDLKAQGSSELVKVDKAQLL
ncbi:unnamed protein product [Amaranthus hypochondriacus]